MSQTSTVADDTPLLRLRGVDKSFGAVQVLHGRDLDVVAGEVTALVGDNGAGKSTLVKCVAGIYSIDGGQYFFDGKRVKVASPRDTAALGVEIVYQDLALADNLDIVQNMFLGREELKNGLLDETVMEQKAKEALASLSVRTVKSVRQLADSVLALHLDVHRLTVARVGLGGQVLARADAPLAPGTAPRAAVERAVALVASLLGGGGARSGSASRCRAPSTTATAAWAPRPTWAGPASRWQRSSPRPSTTGSGGPPPSRWPTTPTWGCSPRPVGAPPAGAPTPCTCAARGARAGGSSPAATR